MIPAGPQCPWSVQQLAISHRSMIRFVYHRHLDHPQLDTRPPSPTSQHGGSPHRGNTNWKLLIPPPDRIKQMINSYNFLFFFIKLKNSFVFLSVTLKAQGITVTWKNTSLSQYITIVQIFWYIGNIKYSWTYIVYTYVHTYIHTYIYTYIHTYIHTYTHIWYTHNYDTL